jgi:hypothetical protein
MKEASPINRTYHPKYVTYNGDGNGRDHYITFDNGGLHKLRDYRGSHKKNSFSIGQSYQTVTPKKDATAFDYVPDGSGRDTYVIKQFGLKRDYKSHYRDFETNLRARV